MILQEIFLRNPFQWFWYILISILATIHFNVRDYIIYTTIPHPFHAHYKERSWI